MLVGGKTTESIITVPDSHSPRGSRIAETNWGSCFRGVWKALQGFPGEMGQGFWSGRKEDAVVGVGMMV